MTKKKKQVTDRVIVVSAIAALVIIECVALSNGINGTLLLAITALIAGLAGWSSPQLKLIKK